ncbi:hypothetical protein [Microbacterium sp.]|uniref:hypothetical protein n=1 Tax=Microbacterium sp. TaxID=51671 RepID=UPI0039E2AFD3
MPLLLSSRAATRSPVPLIAAAVARDLHLPVTTAAYHRVRSGVYVERAAWERLKPWERYEVRVHAFLLAHPDAILCLESAAVILGLPLFGETRDIHVFDPGRTASRRFGDVCVHTSESAREVVVIAGIRVTSLLDTAADLARVLPAAQGLSVTDAAISPAQGGALTVAALRAHVAEQPNRRGRARLEWVLGMADPRAESPGETVSRAVIRWAGFEDPELQPVFFYEGFQDRCDFIFPSSRSLGESDGWGKYDLADPVAAERHLREEKRREDRLRRGGHPFGRWDLADAFRVAPLCRVLVAAKVRQVRPMDPRGLATLRRTPRTLPRPGH